jgi:exodeoxyribonuclease V alpha subunit
MRGGMKVYAGSPAAARVYLEADRGRADDYYLAEGTGLARRFEARDGQVRELATLAGDGYETWVAGRDPETDAPRGRLRTDQRAVRFVEVVVNGPKSWSLAAAMHRDVAAAYDAARDRAAAEVIGWLARHATTRVGPRGGQVQAPVEVLEAVTVRHYTSRAGDPHRHLHLQIGARVLAAGEWRGLHTVGRRTRLPRRHQWNRARRGRLRPAVPDGAGRPRLQPGLGWRDTGARRLCGAVQRTRGADRAQPGPLRTRLDRRAPRRGSGTGAAAGVGRPRWADGRPDKITPQCGAGLIARWRSELAALGYAIRHARWRWRPPRSARSTAMTRWSGC